MPRLFTSLLALSVALSSSCTTANSKPDAKTSGVSVTPENGIVRIAINGEPLTEYHYGDAPHTYFFPLYGPKQIPMTRNAPMKEVENEERDHPHHRSLWFSHGDVNGIDFWSETAKAGKIQNEKILETTSGTDQGKLRVAHRWVAPDGKVVLTDETVFIAYRTSTHRIFDFEVTLKAPRGEEVTLGDTKEGTMGIRLAESMRLKPNKFYTGKPTGRIVQNTGVRDQATWGKRAAWCDYSGPINGQQMGVAILDHPGNPRHPTWWHVRDYGLFAANPFGLHDFEKKPAGSGKLVIKAGQSVTFKYRFVLHEGDAAQAGIANLFESYAAGKLN